MPYITMNRREAFFKLESELIRSRLDTAGEMNYLITQVFLHYIAQHGLTYQSINDCLGAAAGASQELYRRIASQLEDKKAVENGDVYDVFEGNAEGGVNETEENKLD